jgi:hypothetical protein
VSNGHFGTVGRVRRTITLLACASALGVLGAACGSNDARIPPARAVEKSDAINAGDSVCKALAADHKQLVDEFKNQHPSANPDEARDFLVNTLSPRIEQAVGDFHRIGEPTKDKNDWDEIVANLDGDLVDFKSKIGTDPVAQVGAQPFAGEASSFDTYGFKECGKAIG